MVLVVIYCSINNLQGIASSSLKPPAEGHRALRVFPLSIRKEGTTSSAGAVSYSQRGTHLVDVLEVQPGVKGPDGQIQVRQLQLRHPRADVPFVSVDAEGGEAQAVLVQHALLHGDGVVLVKDHSEGVCLDLDL